MSKAVVYLPAEYYPTATWIAGSTVVIGTEAGKVLVFGFKEGVRVKKFCHHV